MEGGRVRAVRQSSNMGRAVAAPDAARCQGELVRRDVSNFVECSGCGGVWLGEDSFEDFVDRGDESTMATFLGPSGDSDKRDKSLAAAREDTVGYVPCPECGQMMNRKNFASCSGVVIDWCRGHGYPLLPSKLNAG